MPLDRVPRTTEWHCRSHSSPIHIDDERWNRLAYGGAIARKPGNPVLARQGARRGLKLHRIGDDAAMPVRQAEGGGGEYLGRR